MGPIATGLGEVLHYVVTGAGNDVTELRTIHDWIIKPKMRIKGVAEINSWGGYEKQYQVRIDPDKLIKHGLTFSEVVEAVRGNNLNVGGGNSTVAEGPTPGNAETQMNIDCTGTTCVVSGRTSAETGSAFNCSDTGCPFGPWLPISNAGASTCVRNTFSTPASGTLEMSTGGFVGAFPLSSAVYLTANATLPCPLCVGGQPGVANSGTCQSAAEWSSGAGPSPDAGNACTPVNADGNTHDCGPPPAVALTPFAVNLDPITTGISSFSNASGLFCPSQATGGAFGCSGAGSPNAICPGGNLPPVPDYVEEVGTEAGPLTVTRAPPALWHRSSAFRIQGTS